MEKSPPPPYSAQNHPPYAAPPQGYGPPPNQPQGYGPPFNQPQGNTVVMVAPSVVAAFGPESQTLACPYCHHQITSRVESEASSKTHLFALILCLFGCIPCCLIPYCSDSCQNRNHYCPSCGAFLGAYSN